MLLSCVSCLKSFRKSLCLKCSLTDVEGREGRELVRSEYLWMKYAGLERCFPVWFCTMPCSLLQPSCLCLPKRFFNGLWPVEPAEPGNLIKPTAIEMKFCRNSGFPCVLQTDGCEVWHQLRWLQSLFLFWFVLSLPSVEKCAVFSIFFLKHKLEGNYLHCISLMCQNEVLLSSLLPKWDLGLSSPSVSNPTLLEQRLLECCKAALVLKWIVKLTFAQVLI